MQTPQYHSAHPQPGIIRRRRQAPRLVRRDPQASLRRLADDLAAAHDLIESLEISELEARAKAEAVGEAAHDVLSILSHELRTPLQAIFGYAELLEAGIHGNLNEAQRLDISRIQQSQKQLLMLLDSVMRRVRTERLPPPAG